MRSEMKPGLLDWIIIFAYLLSLIGMGIVASRRVKDTKHYFLGKRTFGKLIMIAQTFSVGTHAEMPVSLSGAVYSFGISAIWYQWKNLFASPFYWAMAPVFRRVRRTTTAEMMEDRYGPGMSGLYASFAFAFLIINMASILKGAAKILNQMGGINLGVNSIVLGLTLIFVFYSFVGGLVASAWSNLVQGFLLIVLSFMLIPMGWSAVGGLGGMREVLPAHAFSLATPKEVGPWFIVMLTLNGLIGIMAMPHVLAAVGTGKDEYTCRVGFFHGMWAKRVCTIGWAIVGLMVAAMIKLGRFDTHALKDPEDAFGFACQHLLSPGLRGLLIASVMGACLAACSALMVDSGALSTQGFYRPRLAPQKPDQHYLWVGRVSGLAAVLIAVFYALFLIQRVLYSFLLTETMAAYMGISVVAELVWKRANRWGAAASLLVSLGTNFSLYHLKHQRLDYWDPGIFFSSLAAGVVTLIVISLLTPAEADSRVDPFFTKLQTPSDYLPAAGAPNCTLMEHEEEGDWTRGLAPEIHRWVAQRGRQLLLINLLHPLRGACGVGFFRAYRDDLVGFVVGVFLSVGLVAGLWAFLHLRL
jgi:Na+/proline symporter